MKKQSSKEKKIQACKFRRRDSSSLDDVGKSSFRRGGVGTHWSEFPDNVVGTGLELNMLRVPRYIAHRHVVFASASM